MLNKPVSPQYNRTFIGGLFKGTFLRGKKEKDTAYLLVGFQPTTSGLQEVCSIAVLQVLSSSRHSSTRAKKSFRHHNDRNPSSPGIGQRPPPCHPADRAVPPLLQHHRNLHLLSDSVHALADFSGTDSREDGR